MMILFSAHVRNVSSPRTGSTPQTVTVAQVPRVQSRLTRLVMLLVKLRLTLLMAMHPCGLLFEYPSVSNSLPHGDSLLQLELLGIGRTAIAVAAS